MLRVIAFASVLGTVLLVAGTAEAIPILQVYLEGADYDDVTDTWVLTQPGTSGGGVFRLWTIGNVTGPGNKGPIDDVRLSVAYLSAHLGLTITLTPSRAGGVDVGSYSGVTDPSIPAAPDLRTSVQTASGWVSEGNGMVGGVVTNGSTPVLSDGQALPAHGIFGPGTVWREYDLGDFTEHEDTIGDFIGSFPTSLYADGGQINVYDVSVFNGSGAHVHFDLYNHVLAKNDAKFAPFSHDADGTSNIIPEASSLLTWAALAGIGIVVASLRRRRAD